MYERNGWGRPESVCGAGSNLEQTRVIRRGIAALVEELGIRTMLDAPCGDYHWMRHVPIELDQYIGADIVRELIEEDMRKYAGPTTRFTRSTSARTTCPPSTRSSAATAWCICRSSRPQRPSGTSCAAARATSWRRHTPPRREAQQAAPHHRQLAAARSHAPALLAPGPKAHRDAPPTPVPPAFRGRASCASGNRDRSHSAAAQRSLARCTAPASG